MQLRNQNGKQKNWKVVAAVTAASAIGLSGLALANPGNGSGAPDSIRLRDRTEITQVTTAVTAPGGTTFNTVLSASLDTASDSPFTDSMTDSVSPSMESISPSVSDSMSVTDSMSATNSISDVRLDLSDRLDVSFSIGIGQLRQLLRFLILTRREGRAALPSYSS
jgi:hypothetical protein